MFPRVENKEDSDCTSTRLAISCQDVLLMCSFNAISHSVLLIRLSSSFVSLMLRNDSCSKRKSFPLITVLWYYRQQSPLWAWQLITAGLFTVTWWHYCQGGLPKGKLLQCQFQPSNPISVVVNNFAYFISSQVTTVKLKKCSTLTAQFCFFIIISAIWLVWCIFFREWTNL